MSDNVSQFYKHVDYLHNEPQWETIHDLIKGLHECLIHPKYLWLHTLENPNRQCDAADKEGAKTDRKTREERTQYKNILKMARDRWVSLVMKGGFNVSPEIAALLEDNIQDVDGEGHSLEAFARKVTEHIVSYGVAYVFTDKETKEFRSRAEQLESGSRPYWRLLHPLSVVDWQLGSNGGYQAFRFEYQLQKPRNTLQEEPILAQYCTIGSMEGSAYTLQVYESVNKENITVNYHPDCVISKDNNHASWKRISDIVISEMDSIPLATNRIEDAVLMPGVAVALQIFNKQSDLDNILHGQCYDRVFISSSVDGTLLDEEGNPVSDDTKTIKISSNSLVLLPEGSNVTKLEPTNPQALAESLKVDLQDFYKLVFNQTRSASSDSRAVEGRQTQREVKESLLTLIEGLREQVLGVMNSALQHYAVFQGDSPEIDLQFAQTVTEGDVQEMLSNVRASLDLLRPYEPVIKEITKKVVATFNLPNEEELFQGIDNAQLPRPETGNVTNATRQRLQGLVTPANNRNRNGR